MTSTSRRLAAQVALGAAFATALAWKAARAQRRPERSPLQPGAAAAIASRASRRTAPGRRWLAEMPRARALALVAGVASLAVAVAVVAVLATRSGGSNAAPPAAVASTPVATPSPQPAPTPTLADTLLDARRELDLASVRDALNAYAVFFGTYPSTGGVLRTLCAQPTDVGCTLRKYAATLPTNDGTFPYWYASDGQSFTLLARVQAAPATGACPGGLPAPLAREPVYCVRGTLSAR